MVNVWILGKSRFVKSSILAMKLGGLHYERHKHNPPNNPCKDICV